MKNLRWWLLELLFVLAKWRAGRHITWTNAMIRIMADVTHRQQRMVEEAGNA